MTKYSMAIAKSNTYWPQTSLQGLLSKVYCDFFPIPSTSVDDFIHIPGEALIRNAWIWPSTMQLWLYPGSFLVSKQRQWLERCTSVAFQVFRPDSHRMNRFSHWIQNWRNFGFSRSNGELEVSCSLEARNLVCFIPGIIHKNRASYRWDFRDRVEEMMVLFSKILPELNGVLNVASASEHSIARTMQGTTEILSIRKLAAEPLTHVRQARSLVNRNVKNKLPRHGLLSTTFPHKL